MLCSVERQVAMWVTNWEEWETKQPCPFLRYSPTNCLRDGEYNKNLRSWYPISGSRYYPRPSEYDTRIWTTRPLRTVILLWFKCHHTLIFSSTKLYVSLQKHIRSHVLFHKRKASLTFIWTSIIAKRICVVCSKWTVVGDGEIEFDRTCPLRMYAHFFSFKLQVGCFIF